MVKSGMIPGMPPNLHHEDPPKCKFCVLGKQMKTPVPKHREEGPGHRATRKLEKVWVDLSGPHVKSRTGNEYIMNIVDDFTSCVWPIPLKRKSDAFNYLTTWERARELETGLKVGTYITDNGELKSGTMRDWLESRGSNQLFTAPYTSAYIGRVERMHRTLMAKARTMRIYAKCPTNLWDEFYITAGHLQDKTMTRSLDGTTPWQKWYEQQPDYEGFIVPHIFLQDS
jgi:transposase InsO family protein